MNAVDWLLEIPVRYGDRECLVEARTGEVASFGAVDRDARRIAADLRCRGLERGDRIAIVAHNSLALARVYLGCLYAGVVVVPANPVLAGPEIEFIVRASGAVAVVVSAETAALVEGVSALPRLALVDGRGEPANADGERWDVLALPDDDASPMQGASPDDTLAIIFTSGTTGRPTGVVHRLGSLIDNGRLFGETVGIGPRHRFYGVLAMTYLGGYYNLLLLPYVNGASVLLADTFGARTALDFWSPAASHGVTALWLVPTIMSILLELDRGAAGEQFCRDAIDLMLVGTAPLAPSLRRSFEQRYGVQALENYALSETLFLTTNVPGRPVIDGSSGRTLEGIGLRLDSEPEGELLAHSPYALSSIVTEDGDRPPPLVDGWLRTGDLGRIDQQGNVFITGRKKDLIIRGGVNVSPAATEDVLLDHPEVAECAVVGVPHPVYGEDSVAVVRLTAGAEADRARRELVAICRERLGPSNRPSRILFMDALPHSSSGKIQKGRLRELLAKELEGAR
jgi:long-chain acyl-CoA synthetase